MNLIKMIKDNKVDFDELQMMEITLEDINEFYECMKKVKELEAKYNKAFLNRIKIAAKLKNELYNLRIFTWLLNNKVDRLHSKYEIKANKLNDFITDYKLAMRLILRLANSNGDKYEMKRFHSNDYISGEIKCDDKEENMTFIIGEKKALEKIDNYKLYFKEELIRKNFELLKNGYSLVVVTNNYFDDNAKLQNLAKFLENIILLDIETSGSSLNSPDISCYLFNDELKEAVEKFKKYIINNGPDIKGLDEEELFKVINNQYNTKDFIKKLKKN